MTKIRKWKILKSQSVIDHQWVKVRQDQLELPNGLIIDDYFVNIRPDIALILAITPAQEIVFVRQYRHGVAEILLELPGGTFNPTQENGEGAAARELQEETGYVAEKIIKLATLYDNPVKDTNQIHLFLAENVQQQTVQKLDLTEDVEIELIAIATVMEKISSREICVSGTIAAIFLGLNFLSNR